MDGKWGFAHSLHFGWFLGQIKTFGQGWSLWAKLWQSGPWQVSWHFAPSNFAISQGLFVAFILGTFIYFVTNLSNFEGFFKFKTTTRPILAILFSIGLSQPFWDIFGLKIKAEKFCLKPCCASRTWKSCFGPQNSIFQPPPSAPFLTQNP